MNEEIKEEKGARTKMVWKDGALELTTDGSQYTLRNKGQLNFFHDLESAFREIFKYKIATGLKTNNTNEIKGLVKTMEKAELFIKEIANSIPRRELSEQPDIHVDAKDYFDPREKGESGENPHDLEAFEAKYKK